MQSSKDYMKENGMGTRISFADGSTHTVKLLKDRVNTIKVNGEDVKGMEYKVEENGEEKTIFTGSIGLISKLAVCEVGDVVTINMYKANNKSYYKVVKVGGAEIKAGTEEEDAPGADVNDRQPPASAEW